MKLVSSPIRKRNWNSLSVELFHHILRIDAQFKTVFLRLFQNLKFMKKYGIIGKSLSHSFSPKYFNAKFRKESLDATFEAYELEDIEQFSSLIELNSLQGLCVTVPYKEKIIPFLDELDEKAAKIGAVNCIQMHKGIFKGFNTDIIGFKESLIPLLETQHKKALILGNGGASKAVQQGLTELGIEFRIVSRNPKNGELTYEELDEEIIKTHQLIVNASPVGTFPNVSEKPLVPYQFLNEKHLLYDLVYNPETTAFLEAGEQQGAKIKNGYEMLELQAEVNWKIWNT